MSKETELAWAAGFFDGEGHIRCYSNGNLAISVPQVDFEPLKRFQTAVDGLGSVNGPYAHHGPRAQPQFVLSVYGEKAKQAIKLIMPYLCSIKLDQAEEALALSHHIKTAKPRNQPYVHGTARAYRRGCRCQPCKKAINDYSRELYAKNKGSNLWPAF